MNLTTTAKAAVLTIATAAGLLFGAQAASAGTNPWDGAGHITPTTTVTGDTNPWDGATTVDTNPWD